MEVTTMKMNISTSLTTSKAMFYWANHVIHISNNEQELTRYFDAMVGVINTLRQDAMPCLREKLGIKPEKPDYAREGF